MPSRKKKTKKPQPADDGYQSIAVNRAARFNYEVTETVEAGLVLTGTEVKSVRAGRVSLAEAFARRIGNEMWLHGAHIATYRHASLNNHEPTRPRKLLLHKKQIAEWGYQAEAQSMTIVPLRLYIRDHRVKLLLGLGRGRRKYDKRQVIAKRDAERRMRDTLRTSSTRSS